MLFLCNCCTVCHIITMVSNDHHGVSFHHHFNVCSTACSTNIKENIKRVRLLVLCERNPLVTSGFSSQRANNTESVSTWWHYYTCQNWPWYIKAKLYILSLSSYPWSWLLSWRMIFDLGITHLHHQDINRHRMWQTKHCTVHMDTFIQCKPEWV